MTPASPEERWLDVRGLRLHYRDWGGSGRPVVLLHGLASTCRIWDFVAPILAKGFRVVAVDQRGHGESAKPQDGYDFATLVEDLRGFIGALGLERPIVAGHSWGADVALEYAVAHPQGISGLCFVDGGTIEVSSRPGMTLEKAKEDLAPPDFTGVTIEQLKERVKSWPMGGTVTPELAEVRLSNFEIRHDGTVRSRLSRENHMRIIEAMWEHRPSLLYPRVECPVLLMPARQDGVDSPMARRFNREESIAAATRLLPTSKAVWLEDSIHDVPLQRPELVAEVIGDHARDGFLG
ncbi:MAG: alpha/beta hydrolase [Chloroflexi bacterium]|nr:alpha/beta hydrolase [Chloroflexota bacterium]